jgi:hypothetical protein
MEDSTSLGRSFRVNCTFWGKAFADKTYKDQVKTTDFLLQVANWTSLRS